MVLKVGDRLEWSAHLWVGKGDLKERRGRADVHVGASLWPCVESA